MIYIVSTVYNNGKRESQPMGRVQKIDIALSVIALLEKREVMRYRLHS